MKINLKAAANVGEKQIDLEWAWQAPEPRNIHFSLFRRLRSYPVIPSDPEKRPNDIVTVFTYPNDSTDGVSADGVSATLSERDDPGSGDRLFVITVADKGIEANVCYYYTLLAEDDLSPRQSLRAMATAPGKYGFSDQLYRLLPGVFRYYDEPEPSDRNTGQLRRFLEVAGGTLDYLRGSAESLRYIHDALEIRADLLPHLARYIGWDLDLTKDVLSQRMEILFASDLYRTVGTIPNLQALVNTVIGWKCRIKEFANNVLFSNAPETLGLWDIWSTTRALPEDTPKDLPEDTPIPPTLRAVAENYCGKPAAVVDGDNNLWLFWSSGQKGGGVIWRQKLDAPNSLSQPVPLCPEGEPGRPLLNVGAPAVIKVSDPITTESQLWLFCESGQPGNRAILWAPLQRKGDEPFSARNLMPYPGDHTCPAAVVFGEPDNEQVWLFWQCERRESTDIWAMRCEGGLWKPPMRLTDGGSRKRAPAVVYKSYDNNYNSSIWLFCCEEQEDTGSKICCRVFDVDNNKWMDWEYINATAPNAGSPAPVVWNNKLWLFFHSRDSKGLWQIGSMTLDDRKWIPNDPVNEHLAPVKEPAAVVDAKGKLRLFWLSQRRGYFREKDEKSSRGYPFLSCSLDRQNGEMLTHARLGIKSFDNRVHYTYDTRKPSRWENTDVWCNWNTVGVFLTPPVFESELITRGQQLVEGLIRKFLPAQIWIVFIIELPVVDETVYTYDFPDKEPSHVITEEYEVTLIGGVEQYDGLKDDITDDTLDWIELRAWAGEDEDKMKLSVDFSKDPIVTKYRTRQSGITYGGK